MFVAGALQQWAGRFGWLDAAAGTFQRWPAAGASEAAAAEASRPPSTAGFLAALQPGPLYVGVPSMQAICAHMVQQLEGSGLGRLALSTKVRCMRSACGLVQQGPGCLKAGCATCWHSMAGRTQYLMRLSHRCGCPQVEAAEWDEERGVWRLRGSPRGRAAAAGPGGGGQQELGEFRALVAADSLTLLPGKNASGSGRRSGRVACTVGGSPAQQAMPSERSMRGACTPWAARRPRPTKPALLPTPRADSAGYAGLCGPSSPVASVAQRIQEAAFEPVFSLMVAYEQPLGGLPFDAAAVGGASGAWQWVACNSSKPGEAGRRAAVSGTPASAWGAWFVVALQGQQPFRGMCCLPHLFTEGLWLPCAAAGRPAGGPQCWVAVTTPSHARRVMERFPLHVQGQYNPQTQEYLKGVAGELYGEFEALLAPFLEQVRAVVAWDGRAGWGRKACWRTGGATLHCSCGAMMAIDNSWQHVTRISMCKH